MSQLNWLVERCGNIPNKSHLELNLGVFFFLMKNYLVSSRLDVIFFPLRTLELDWECVCADRMRARVRPLLIYACELRTVYMAPVTNELIDQIIICPTK